MARRGRVIFLATGLLLVFFFLSSRKSGSHPRDLQRGRFQEGHNELRPMINEPPGKWDPIEDKFKNQEQIASGEGNDIGKYGVDESIERKTPKKGPQNIHKEVVGGKEETGSGMEPKKHELQGGGRESGNALDNHKEVVLKEYDPAAGFVRSVDAVLIYLQIWKSFLLKRP